MNKTIADEDRIIIGVREWAVDTVFSRGLEMDKWQRPTKEPDAKIVCGMAQTLEEYVLKGIKDKEAKT